MTDELPEPEDNTRATIYGKDNPWVRWLRERGAQQALKEGASTVATPQDRAEILRAYLAEKRKNDD